MKNTMTVNVYRRNSETGEVTLVRVYPCYMVCTSHDDNTMTAVYINKNGKNYIPVLVNSWDDEFYEIESN